MWPIALNHYKMYFFSLLYLSVGVALKWKTYLVEFIHPCKVLLKNGVHLISFIIRNLVSDVDCDHHFNRFVVKKAFASEGVESS